MIEVLPQDLFERGDHLLSRASFNKRNIVRIVFYETIRGIHSDLWHPVAESRNPSFAKRWLVQPTLTRVEFCRTSDDVSYMPATDPGTPEARIPFRLRPSMTFLLESRYMFLVAASGAFSR